ncbi:hypothetical protein C7R94_03470 [Brevibacillus sp. NRRL NRS-603]|nr:hypothetical protein C7R94_03470 [Brevibacillus sp. NRRL NRS-603]
MGQPPDYIYKNLITILIIKLTKSIYFQKNFVNKKMFFTMFLVRNPKKAPSGKRQSEHLPVSPKGICFT